MISVFTPPRRSASIAAVAALLALAGGGCRTHAVVGTTQPGRLVVVATTTQMQDLVRHVGGAHVQLVGVLRPNVDPHDYEPSPADAVAASHARLAVESGVGIDTWAAQILQASGSGARVWVASRGLALRDHDPHWWFDPGLFRTAALHLGAELGRVDPAHARSYRARAARYAAAIGRMDAANRRLIATVPPAERRLVTNHDAFGYLAAHYGIHVVGSVIPSLSAAAQPSAAQVAALIRRIRAQRVRTVFTESSLNPALENQVAREAGVRVSARLYGDTLGPPGSPGATYIGMMRWDIRQIVAGLRGR